MIGLFRGTIIVHFRLKWIMLVNGFGFDFGMFIKEELLIKLLNW